MANPSQAAEMAQVLDLRQVWFTDLLLLGFDPVAQEDKTKVRFCRCPHIHVHTLYILVHPPNVLIRYCTVPTELLYVTYTDR